MNTTPLLDEISRAVDRSFDEQIRFLSDFVEIPSLRGAEAPAQDFVARALRARGYDVDRWKVDPDDLTGMLGFSPVDISYDQTYSVVGALRCPEPKGRSLILQGHCDVVPAGPHIMWDTPPFRAVIKDGWMYGRGAGDMKGGLVCAIYAIGALAAAGYRPAADLFLQSVAEEESTGNGALSTIQRGYRADAVLIPESSRFKLARAQVGVIWFRIRVRGVPVHAADTGEGVNAIEACAALIPALKDLEVEWNRRAKDDAVFGHHQHPINLNIGQIEGGDWPSSVPSWCEMSCRFGILPSQSVDDAKGEIERCIMHAAAEQGGLEPEVVWNGFATDGYVLENADDLVATLASAKTAVVGGQLEEWVLTSLTDTRIYGRYYGMPSLSFGPTSENYHGFNERTNIESLRQCTKIIALFVAEWCGLEGTG